VPGVSGVCVRLCLSHLLVHAKAPGRYHDHQDELYKDNYGVEFHKIDILPEFIKTMCVESNSRPNTVASTLSAVTPHNDDWSIASVT